MAPKAYLSAINLAMLDSINEIDDMKVQMKSKCRRLGKHHSKVHTKVELALKKNEFHGHQARVSELSDRTITS